MRACHISDCHDVNIDLDNLVPNGIDILFITGDMTYRGRPEELSALLDQLTILRARIKYIICVAGNHELGCEQDVHGWKEAFCRAGCVLLHHESIEIDGVKIFGSPYTPAFFDWAFMYDPKDASSYWDQIPSDTQVLLTHGPPYGILDKCPNGNVGCPTLRDKVLNDLPNLKYHMFGHIHPSFGKTEISGVEFSNGSIMNDRYKPVYKPLTFDLKVK